MSQTVAGKILKALYSAGIAFLGTLGTALSGNEPFTKVTPQQWVWILLATLVAAGGTFGLAGWAGPRINGSSGSTR